MCFDSYLLLWQLPQCPIYDTDINKDGEASSRDMRYCSKIYVCQRSCSDSTCRTREDIRSLANQRHRRSQALCQPGSGNGKTRPRRIRPTFPVAFGMTLLAAYLSLSTSVLSVHTLPLRAVVCGFFTALRLSAQRIPKGTLRLRLRT